jgi:Uma2 family endonuclease
MVQVAPRRMSFEAFLDWHPADGRTFEMIEGIPIETDPTGPHELLSGELTFGFNALIRAANFPFVIPKTATLKPFRDEAGYKPDVVILDRERLAQEPRWERSATLLDGATVRLAVEIISTNWRDDYGLKLNDYEEMGVLEYWIVDYRALGATRYIGRPKVPTISVYSLIDEEYQLAQYRGNQPIVSPTFSALNLTAAQVFAMAQ